MDTSSFDIPSTDAALLDYTEIDQSLNLWSEIFPMIEKEIATLTTVAQEMQDCAGREKYVDALLKIAVRINDVEDKSTKCIKEARTQLKITKLMDRPRGTGKKMLHSTRVRPHGDGEENDDADDEDEEGMDVDESHIDEQIEVPALTEESLDKLKNQLHKVLVKQPDPNAFNVDSDTRYADFAECISKMQGNDNEDDEEAADDDANVVDQVVSNKCPFTQKTFVEAMQNRKCKHKYEKSAVLKYIADKNKSRRPAKCPSAGCDNVLQEKDLVHV